MREAGSKGFDVVLVDTAGRLHIDEELMEELKEMKKAFMAYRDEVKQGAFPGPEHVYPMLEGEVEKLGELEGE